MMSEYFQFWNYKYVENYYQGIIKRLYITESDLYSLDGSDLIYISIENFSFRFKRQDASVVLEIVPSHFFEPLLSTLH